MMMMVLLLLLPSQNLFLSYCNILIPPSLLRLNLKSLKFLQIKMMAMRQCLVSKINIVLSGSKMQVQIQAGAWPS